jgi:dephospho-CoA kinase
MILVGLTGTLGSGKSTVGGLFEAWGASRIDTDALAREVVRPGRPALERIRATWGDRVLADDGSLDRPGLRRIVTEDADARRTLEGIVHPAVLELLRERLEEARSSGYRVAVLEVPLLLETGLDEMCDLVITVDAPLRVRKSRVCEERGLSEMEFTALNEAQLSGEEKRGRADVVVDNAGSLTELEAAARVAWDTIQKSAEPGGGSAGLWSVDLHMHTRHSTDCLSDPADVVATARRR